MTTKNIAGGTVHKLPTDLRKSIISSPKALSAWQSLTPIARNEWICWTISPKKSETREEHVRRVRSELIEGMRRPCCWLGCIHRKDKKISRSVQWVLDKKKKGR
ncbi:MAG TPA: YdeI/OmpD-associated family protein [Candidatus Paceibacterota bacterium]|nr:YdeI/OmpD-associated family protein [Candidatus Paceibacterota bacterium]